MGESTAWRDLGGQPSERSSTVRGFVPVPDLTPEVVDRGRSGIALVRAALRGDQVFQLEHQPMSPMGDTPMSEIDDTPMSGIPDTMSPIGDTPDVQNSGHRRHRETAAAKAHRLLGGDLVDVQTNTVDNVVATVIGDTDEYVVEQHGAGPWTCTCACWGSRCSHIAAVKVATSRRSSRAA